MPFRYSETCIKWPLNFCGLSKQVVSHDRENKHDFVKTVPDKCWNLCVFNNTGSSYTGSTVLPLIWVNLPICNQSTDNLTDLGEGYIYKQMAQIDINDEPFIFYLINP